MTATIGLFICSVLLAWTLGRMLYWRDRARELEMCNVAARVENAFLRSGINASVRVERGDVSMYNTEEHERPTLPAAYVLRDKPERGQA